MNERPALLVLDNDLAQTLPERWKNLAAFRADIREGLPKVGRIARGSGPAEVGLGTGFVAAPGVIVTNRHVLRLLGDTDPAEGPADGCPSGFWRKWQLARAFQPIIDFRVEHSNRAVRKYRITGVLGAPDEQEHPLADIAFLTVATTSDEPKGMPLPEPAILSADPPDAGAGKELYAIGYPSADNEALPSNAALREQVEKAMAEIFGGLYGVKRLQPGEIKVIMDEEKVFSHDCSTLGGNSGSCVVNLRSKRILGLHFKGARMRSNWAVAWWKYREDPFLSAKVGVRFG